MACGDVLSLEDLQTAKKHQIFEAEVITGKAGGVAGGANIGTATNPVTGQTQQTLPSILADLGFDVQSWASSTGGVLASANQVFLNDTSGSLGLGDYYAWGGPFPKTVPAGTDPALPAGGYIMRSSRFAGVQAREALRRSYAEAGYNLVVGSFEVGGALVNANDVLLQERTGKAFSGPIGTVAAGTNPVGGGFVDRSAETLRHKLALNTGAGMVATADGRTVQERFDNIPAEVDAAGTAAALISQHNSSSTAHPELSAFISTEANRAEAARDAAFVNADVYPDVAAGRAAVADGEQFQVVVNDEIVRYRRDSASTQTEVVRYPSSVPVKSSARIGVMVTNNASSINIDFNLNIFEVIPTQVRVFYGSRSLLLPGVSLDISIAEIDRPTRIAFDTVSQAYSVLGRSEALAPSMVVICYIKRATQEVLGVPQYSINGQSVPKVVARGSLVGLPKSINLDRVAGHLQISGGVRVLIPELSFSPLLSEQSVTLPSTGGTYGLYYRRSGDLQFILGTQPPDADAVILGYYLANSNYLIGIDQYYVNGAPRDERAYTTGSLVFSGGNVNINTTSRTLEITTAQAVRLVIPGKPSPGLLPVQSVPLPSSSGTWVLYCLPSMMLTFTPVSADAPPSATLIGYHPGNSTRIFGLDNNYYIDGAPQIPRKESIVTASVLAAAGDFDPNYDQPTLPAYNAEQEEASDDFNKIYALYDDLALQYPDYISSTVLGVDGLGNEIKQYIFNEPQRLHTSNAPVKVLGRRPKVVLISGIHGNERAGIWNIYLAMKEICGRWGEDKKLEALRFGVDFVIVPVSVPTGYNGSRRKNHNGVDIARNFPSNWVNNPDPNSETYGGAAPMDQQETVLLDGVMRDHSDAVYFGSHHNFFASEAHNFIWNASATQFGINLGNRLVAIQSIKAAIRYPELPKNSSYMGYADLGAPVGSEGRHAAKRYGMNAGTFEIGRSFDLASDSGNYSSFVATVGVETLINWILLNVKHGTDITNARIRT